MCSRSVWNPLKAVFTVFTASAVACAWSEHASAEVVDELDEGDALGDAVGLTLVEGDADGLAVGLADADGLALAWVIVTVVTPFCTVAVTSAPVVPITNTAAMAPDFADSNSSKSFS